MNDGSTALVTGAGAGTGKEYVRLLLADNATVLAVSLLEDELSDLEAQFASASGKLITMQADLSTPGAAQRVMTWCDENHYEVDTLINNAGFAAYGDPAEIALDTIERMLRLNVIASTELSMVFGTRMAARGKGRILVMGSSAGFAPTARLAAYGASKAYTNAFTLALGADLEQHGVRVTCVAPGAFRSKFADTANVTGFTGASLTQRIYAGERLDAAAVARAGYRAMQNGKPFVTVGAKAVALKVLARLLPAPFIARHSRML